MKTLVLAAFVLAIILCGLIVAVIVRPNRPADRFYAILAANVNSAIPGQTVFQKTDTPAVVVRGRGFEERELRLVITPEAKGVEVINSNPARLTKNGFHGWSFPGVKPGNYRVVLLVDGRRTQELLITVNR